MSSEFLQIISLIFMYFCVLVLEMEFIPNNGMFNMLPFFVNHTLDPSGFRTEQVAPIPDFPVPKVSLTCLCAASACSSGPLVAEQGQNLSFLSLDRDEVDWIFQTSPTM